jgi:hypothetical protein
VRDREGEVNLFVFVFASPVPGISLRGFILRMVFFLLVTILVVLTTRNFWLLDVHHKHIEAVYAFTLRQIDRGKYEPGLSRRMYRCFWPWGMMLLHFWIWDPKRMLADEEAFNRLGEAT